MEINEDHPIYKAIDRGGGQCCDVHGVIRALAASGYAIVPIEPTKKMFDAAMPHMDSWSSNTAWWQDMIAEAMK